MNTTLTKQLEAFNQGIIMDSDGAEDTGCYNFFDWFCKEKSLEAKSKKLFRAVKRWVKEMNIDTDKVYVTFKNNCPMFGPLYDDFRICDIETDNVIWTVTPKSGHSGQAEAWGRVNGFQGPFAVAPNMTELYKVLETKK